MQTCVLPQIMQQIFYVDICYELMLLILDIDEDRILETEINQVKE